VLGAAVGGLAAVGVGVALAARLSPWPGVLLLRWYGGRLDAEQLPARAAALEALVPAGVGSDLDVAYLDDRPAARLDVHRPAVDGPLPAVVWVHGGGYIGGTKDDLREYLRVLAGHGFATVGVDYTHAPSRTYPTQIEEVGAALRFLVDHADRYGIDPDRLVLAGDSAGAHIAAQAGFAIADGTYATDAGLPRPIPARSLRALVLCCGPYRMIEQRVSGMTGFFVRTILWAYSGERDPARSGRFAHASVTDHVPAGLPPTYVTCGNDDPLLPHSRALVAALEAAGVDVDAHLHDEDHPARLAHEYQFDLRIPEAAGSLARIVALVQRATSPAGAP